MKKLPFILWAIALCCAGCKKPPEYPATPSIEFKSIRTERTESGNEYVYVTLSFKDGDGDMGASSDDTVFINQQQPINYFATLLEFKGGIWKPFVFPDPNFNFNGRFNTLNPGGNVGPIEGDLDYRMLLINFNNTFPPNHLIKYEIYILDKAGNRSNTIETDTIRIFTPVATL